MQDIFLVEASTRKRLRSEVKKMIANKYKRCILSSSFFFRGEVKKKIHANIYIKKKLFLKCHETIFFFN